MLIGFTDISSAWQSSCMSDYLFKAYPKTNVCYGQAATYDKAFSDFSGSKIQCLPWHGES